MNGASTPYAGHPRAPAAGLVGAAGQAVLPWPAPSRAEVPGQLAFGMVVIVGTPFLLHRGQAPAGRASG